jgi:hypothetical protein
VSEYLFDVKLFAGIRVDADNLKNAQDAVRKVVDGMEPDFNWIRGFNMVSKTAQLVDVTLSEDGEEDNKSPVEIDGEFQ